MNPDFERYKQYRTAEATKTYLANLQKLNTNLSINLNILSRSWIRNKQQQKNKLVADYNQAVATLNRAFNTQLNQLKSLALPVTTLPIAKKKALLIGINYLNTPYALSGCIDDTTRMNQFLTDSGVTICNTLTDHTPTKPTKANILSAFQQMITESVPGDLLIFYFSGHGSSTFDYTGDEADGKDEMIISLDLQAILDDEFKKILSTKMKEGVSLFALFDSCFSGTMFDLKYQYLDSTNYDKYTENERVNECKGNILMISGCMDSQTSEEAVVNGKVEGAVSWAFLEATKQNPTTTWRELLKKMRDLLRSNGFQQIPQLSTDSFFNIDSKIYF